LKNLQIPFFIIESKIYGRVAGYEVGKSPAFKRFPDASKLDSYVTSIAFKNSLAKTAFPLAVGCTPSKEKAPPLTKADVKIKSPEGRPELSN
jgi:hypothetical protein